MATPGLAQPEVHAHAAETRECQRHVRAQAVRAAAMTILPLSLLSFKRLLALCGLARLSTAAISARTPARPAPVPSPPADASLPVDVRTRAAAGRDDRGGEGGADALSRDVDFSNLMARFGGAGFGVACMAFEFYKAPRSLNAERTCYWRGRAGPIPAT